jgi:adenylate cyclase
VHTPPRILVVDDTPENVEILQARLTSHGYDVLTAADGEQAIAVATAEHPDLILLDVMMPKLDGIEVCRRLRSDSSLPFMPIILVTVRTESRDVVAGLEAGADEYLTKPVDHAALVARVKSMLRTKALHDTVQQQATRLEVQAAELAEWNRTLATRVEEQLGELERVSRLKRFFSPQLAEMIVSAGGERLLESHRREITVVFGDLRGFSTFAETAEPENVMDVLREYHGAVGPAVTEFEGTLERFTGDGFMVFFNDPIPCTDDPTARAVRMAVTMQDRVRKLVAAWGRRGDHLDFGLGIALGYATLGKIGFEGRIDYAAIGTVTNLAARLCGEAKGGQVLVTSRVLAAVEDLVEAEPIGELSLKGFQRPLAVWNVLRFIA